MKRTDVPLLNATILWRGRAETAEVKVVRHPWETHALGVIGHSSSDGADWVEDWPMLSDASRLAYLFMMGLRLIVEDNIPAEKVHEAFQVIPEYRDAMKKGVSEWPR